MEQRPIGLPEPRYDIIVIAASAGGVEALRSLLGALPPDFPVPIAVVLHRSPSPPLLLERVLRRSTTLPVKQLTLEHEPIVPGTIHLARPDLHLHVHDRCNFISTDGRRIRHVRSSANPLFESAARVFGARVLAVVLTGGDSDGTDGVQTVKKAGGTVIAQDEATSANFNMPQSAIQTGSVDYVLPLAQIGPSIVSLTLEPERSLASSPAARSRAPSGLSGQPAR